MRTVAILLLAFMLAIPSCYANPIPVPTVPLVSEDIEIDVDFNDVHVTGVYTFRGVIGSLESVKMMFPIPSDSRNISVKYQEEPLNWVIKHNDYSVHPRILDINLSIIEWTCEAVDSYVKPITVTYRHSLIDLGNGTRILIYALGTAKLSSIPYSKGCTYNVKMLINPKPVRVERLMKAELAGSMYWVNVEPLDGCYIISGTLNLLNMYDDLIIRIQCGEGEWMPAKPSDLNASMPAKPSDLNASSRLVDVALIMLAVVLALIAVIVVFKVKHTWHIY